MKTILALLFVSCVLTACDRLPEDLKSPCVGTADSPCDRRPVNPDFMRS